MDSGKKQFKNINVEVKYRVKNNIVKKIIQIVKNVETKKNISSEQKIQIVETKMEILKKKLQRQ